MYTPKNIPQKIPTGTNSSFPLFPPRLARPQLNLCYCVPVSSKLSPSSSSLTSSPPANSSSAVRFHYYNIITTFLVQHALSYSFLPVYLSLSLALAVVVVF